MACKSCGFNVKFCAKCGTNVEIPVEIELSKDSMEPDLSSAVELSKDHKEHDLNSAVELCKDHKETDLNSAVELSKDHKEPDLNSSVEQRGIESFYVVERGCGRGFEEYKLIVYGLPGSGVSSTVNTILGIEQMKTGISFDRTTETCRLGTCERLGYKLEIVDVPGLDTETGSNADTDRFLELKNGIEMLAPGPNVLILVTPVDRYNEENNFLVSSLNCLEGISKYTIVIFTKADATKNPITGEMISQSEPLRELLALSEGRFQLFNNLNKDEQQVQNLMKMVKTSTDSKQKRFFDHSIFTPDSAKKLSEVVVGCEIKRKKAFDTYTSMNF